MSVAKILICFTFMHVCMLLPNTLYNSLCMSAAHPLESPKFRVGSGARVATRPARFLSKNLDRFPDHFLVTNETQRSGTAVTADPPFMKFLPHPDFYVGNSSTSTMSLTQPSYPFGADSRQLLSAPTLTTTIVHHYTTKSSEYSNPQPFSALANLTRDSSTIPSDLRI